MVVLRMNALKSILVVLAASMAMFWAWSAEHYRWPMIAVVVIVITVAYVFRNKGA